MVEAGLRKRRVAIRVEEPEAVAAALRRHMKPDDLARLGKMLTAE